MRIRTSLLLAACGTGWVCLSLGAWPRERGSHDEWPVKQQETITKTLHLAGDPLRLVVENVDGYVHVTGGAGSEVRVSAHKTIRAESDTDFAEAKKDVNLSFEEKPGTVSISYDAPWICRGEGADCHGSHRHFYNVTYDIDIEAPAAAQMIVSTVNRGDIKIENATGNFEISDINGGISMRGITGSGEVRTINGPVEVAFARNPSAPVSFKSINGALDVTCQPGLGADLLFKTMNGQIFSDFEVSARPVPASQAERRDGRFIYRSNDMKGARVGSGGPELSFNTLNGNVYLHRVK